jgi:hypothetical protein
VSGIIFNMHILYINMYVDYTMITS